MGKKTILTIVVMAIFNMKASASPQSEQTVDSSKVVDLDEIIVVSQPKEYSLLRRQPIASSVFTGKELENTNATELSSLSMFVPSFAVPAYGSRYTSSIYVRGIGSRSGDPSVGLYYDNIPLVSKSTFNRHFYQIDRVDVFSGPQGTLYGINSESGLVRMYSKNPMSYQGTDLRTGFGTGLYSNIEVAHHHRPSDNFAFSVAGFYSGLGGFFDNTNLNKKADLTNEAGARMRFVLEAPNGWKFDMTTDYQYTNQNAFAYGEYDNETSKFSNPSTTFMNGYKRQMVTIGLHVSHTMPHLFVTSTTSHQYLYDFMQMDQDYMPKDYMRMEQRQKMNALTEELSLRTRDTDRWQHTSGLFFSYQWLHTNAPVGFGDDMNRMIVNNMGMPAYVASNITISDNCVLGDFLTPQFNIGLFHESNINITDKLTFTLGLRYDHHRVSIDYDSNARFQLGYSGTMQGHHIKVSNYFHSTFASSTAEDYDQLLPKLAIAYHFDTGNIYATMSKGFRAGGYNLQMFSDIFKTEQSSLGQKLMQLMQGEIEVEHTANDYSNVNNTITYKPETCWNYELGSHLNLLGGKMHADISAYFMQIHDQQLSIMAGNYGYGRMMVNAGRTASYGAEIAIRGNAMSDRLSWTATYGYTHSTFRNYTDNEHNYRGNRVPFVPNHTFSALADYRINRTIAIGMNIAGNGSTYWDTENLYKQKLYAMLGAHTRFDLGRVSINLWGRNLTDTKYNTFLVNSSVDGTNRSFAQRGNPLQAGVDINIYL